MSVIRAGKRTGDWRRTGSRGVVALLPKKKTARSEGIKRRPVLRGFDKTPTPLQAAVLTGVTREPQPPRVIALRAGVERKQAASALRFLCARDLVVRDGAGWRLS